MQPGLARAVPMGIVGFIGGAILVLVMRGLQSVDPIWDPEIGLVLAGFAASFAFVWGMGALNPSVNQHAHEPETDETGLIIADAHDEHHDDEHAISTQKPLHVLGYSVWDVTVLTMLVIGLLFAFATINTGLTIRVSNEIDAATQDVGYYTITLPFGGPTIEVSQLVVFALLGGFTILSVFMIGGALGLMFTSLGKNIKEAKAMDAVPLGTAPKLALPAPEGEEVKVRPAPDSHLTSKSTMFEIAKNGVMRSLPFMGVFLVAFYLLNEWTNTTGIEDSFRVWAVITEWVSTLPAWIASIVALALALVVGLVVTRPLYKARNDMQALKKSALFAGLTFVLYWAFFYILIYYPLLGIARILGWDDVPSNINTVISVLNAVMIVVPLLFPWFALQGASRSARGLLKILRGTPAFLGQK